MSNQQTSPGAVGAGKLPTAWIAGGTLAVVSIAAAAATALRHGAALAPEVAALAAQVAVKPVQTAAVVAPVAPAAPAVPKAAVTPQAARPVVRQAKASVVCAHCGVVESVVAVKRKGEATGLGVVAGGVLGAVVGHQMGNGNGKKAMTVIGAVGGGVAGNEVEKHARGDTVYQVRVRMDDNTERTLEQANAPHVGARVEVQGNTLKALRAAG
jgi:outer membrane lipoprotein SlyB